MFGRSYPIRISIIRKVVCNVEFFGFHSAPPTSLRRRKRSACASVCVCVNTSPPRLFHIFFFLRSILFGEHCVRACDCRCAKRRRCCARCVKANRRQKKNDSNWKKKIGLPYVHSTEFLFTQLSFCHRPSRARARCHTFPIVRVSCATDCRLSFAIVI